MILTFLYDIIIGPIAFILEIIYGFLVLVVRNNHGFSIIGISFIVSLFCLPLYLKAEELQEKERSIQQKMSKKINQIKKYFVKDEQHMLLSAYYRINNYHPLMALRTSLGLLIQIPFFIAAYQFISHFEPLRGEPFLFIDNLGAPDALLKIGNSSFNVLPLLMTGINVISGALYTKNFQFKEKLQIYAVSLIFLVILYNSPAALLLYWTCNNIFSLIKNIILKFKNKITIFLVLMSSLLFCCCLYVLFFRNTGRSNQITFGLLAIFLSLFVLSIPFALKILIRQLKPLFSFLKNEEKRLKIIFILSCISLFILCGIFIPSNITASDAAAFSSVNDAVSPSSAINILIRPILLSLGLFCLWPIYIYSLGNRIFKAFCSFLMPLILIFSVINIFAFTGNYGMLSNTLQFQAGTNFFVSKHYLLFNIFAGVLLFLLLFVVFLKNKLKIVSSAGLFILISVSLFSILKIHTINIGFNEYKAIIENNKLNELNFLQADTDLKFEHEFTLSKTGHNVFVIMLDKAAGIFFKNIINENASLKSSFEGFVHYPNTVSFFRATILGLPPLLGGYDFTPEKLHLRSDETALNKYNEACLFLPELFKENDFAVSVFDLPYVNFQSKMNLSFFIDRKINAGNLEGKYTKHLIRELGSNAPVNKNRLDIILKHNFIMFGIFLSSPVILRKAIYNKGNYWAASNNSRPDIVTNSALNSYAVLHYLPEITEIKNAGNTFTLLVSNMAHDPSFLQYPDYSIVSEITDYGPDIFSGNVNSHQYYHINCASYILLAKWLEFLKQNEVYDNTRIIIVSDHAEVLNDPDNTLDRKYTSYNPILLFKDFNSTGELKTDYTFMTNADTPMLSVKDIISEKIILSEKDEGINIYLGGSSQPQDYPGTDVLEKTSSFYHVKDNIFDADNWTKISKRY